LEQDKSYTYRVKASWIEKGMDVVREKKVVFKAGEDVVIDFRE
jgi:uncharacterized protein (TIGR03000 family)